MAVLLNAKTAKCDPERTYALLSRPPKPAGTKRNFQGDAAQTAAMEVAQHPIDPPPLKWSALRYGFEPEEDRDGEQEAPA
jgi:hypothetical protein